ncbi:unnamed protein product [Trichobilharzia szidati]|nr:unnamed protein product [Trichobilharzia szidati]
MKVNNVVYKAFVSGLNLALCITFGAISYQASFWITNRIGMRLRVAIAGLIFKKMLAFTQKSLAETTSGDIITLLTADIQRFDMAFELLNYVWLAPIQFIVIFWLMSRIALIPSICALIVTILNIPLGFIANKLYSKLRLSVASVTASRIRLLSDIIKGMRTIKFQTWEDAFFKLVGDFRRKETQLILKSRFCQLLRFTQVMCQTKSSMTVFILALVLLNTDSEYLIILKSSYVYTVLNFLGSLFISVTLLLPICLHNIFEVNVASKRVTDFLFLPELGADIPPEVIESVEPFVQFSNVCAKWKDSANTYNLHQINYEVFGPQLVAVVGTVGSGKVSFTISVLNKWVKLCSVLDVSSFERLMGPCVEIMQREMGHYRSQLIESLGPDEIRNIPSLAKFVESQKH